MLVHFSLFFMKLKGFAIVHLQSSDKIILKDKVQQSLMELEGMIKFLMTITIFFKMWSYEEFNDYYCKLWNNNLLDNEF